MPFRRVDPLTGHTSVVFDQTGKPVPARTRAMPAPHGPCVFCAAVTTLDESGTYTDPKFGPRSSTAHSAHGLALVNAWPVVGPDLSPAASSDADLLSADGVAELVVPARHVTSFEELSTDEAVGLLDLVAQRVAANSTWPSVCVFANVGLAAGQSQPHLHFQVVATEVELPLLAAEAASQGPACAVCFDRDASGPRLLNRTPSASWTAAAPTLPGELRVAGPHDDDLFTAATSAELLSAVTAFVAHIGPAAYNITAHLPGPVGTSSSGLHPHWHLMPRMGSGIGIYELGYGIGVGAVDPDLLASALRTARP